MRPAVSTAQSILSDCAAAIRRCCRSATAAAVAVSFGTTTTVSTKRQTWLITACRCRRRRARHAAVSWFHKTTSISASSSLDRRLSRRMACSACVRGLNSVQRRSSPHSVGFVGVGRGLLGDSAMTSSRDFLVTTDAMMGQHAGNNNNNNGDDDDYDDDED